MSIAIHGCCVLDPERYLSQPRKGSFQYYDKNFEFDPGSTNLRIEETYICPGQNKVRGYEDIDFCQFLIFNDDGLVRAYNTNCNVSYGSLNQYKEDFGYFKLIGDSIFFTTKSFYNKKANHYSGIAKQDTLELKVVVGATGKTFYKIFSLRTYPIYMPEKKN
jgi:hypothetical protein